VGVLATTSKAMLFELDFARFLRECARDAAPRAEEVGTTASLNVVTLTNVTTVTHVNKAWTAAVKQGSVGQAFRIEHVTASWMDGTLGIKMLETRVVLAICKARAEPREDTSAARAEAVEGPKGPITLA